MKVKKIISLFLCLLTTINLTSCIVRAEEDNNFLEKSIEQVLDKKLNEITKEEFEEIKELDLSNKDLQGELKEEEIEIIKNFTNLEKLDLSSNKLYGEMPKDLVEIESLKEINFSNNYFYSKGYESVNGKNLLLSGNILSDEKNQYLLSVNENLKKEYIVGDVFDRTNIIEHLQFTDKQGNIKEILSDFEFNITLENIEMINKEQKFISEGNTNCLVKLEELEVVIPIKVIRDDEKKQNIEKDDNYSNVDRPDTTEENILKENIDKDTYALPSPPEINSISGNYIENGWINKEAIINVAYEETLMYNLDNTGWKTFDSRVKDIATGKLHSLILLENGDVYSFGQNDFGQLGLGDSGFGTSRIRPTKIENLSNVKSVAAGGYTSFALLENGDVYSFGNNGSGQLGLGDTVTRNIPTKIESLSNVKSVSTGVNHSLILLENGDVYSFGAILSGQLGLGYNSYTTVNVPTKIESISNINSISAGSEYSMFLTADGNAYSCGKNDDGQLGLGHNSYKNTPTIINIGSTSVKAISAKECHSLLLTDNGEVYSFGRNDYGQLGLGDKSNRNSPTKILGVSNISNIAVGYNHSLIVSYYGDVYAFGSNSYGQLGLGNFGYNDYRDTPTKINTLSYGESISAGYCYSLVLYGNGDLYPFGYNSDGQLGTGKFNYEYVPVKLSIFNPFIFKEVVSGMHNYKFKAVNLFHALEGSEQQINFGIDYDNPTIVLTNTVNTKKQKKYSIKCTDNTSGINYILLHTGEKVYQSSYELTITSNGRYNVQVFDKAGNNVSKTITVNDIDTTKPNMPTIKQTSNYEVTISNNGDLGDSYIDDKVASEGFEDTSYNFNFAGSIDNWTLSNSNKQSGNYSIKSATIGDSETTSIEFQVGTDELKAKQIEFYYKVSSENNCDWFRTYVNGVEVLKKSGTSVADFTKVTYDLSPGINTIKFEYKKDVSVNTGDDCVYIDDLSVILEGPTQAPASGVKEIQYNSNNKGWKVYQGPLTLNFGQNVIEAKVVDNAGNESAVSTKTFNRIVPIPTVSGNYKENGWVKNNVTVNVSSENTVYYSLNSGAWTQMTGNTLTVSEEKNHILQIKAVGNSVDSSVVTLKFGIDKTAPSTPTITGKESSFTITTNGDNLSGVKEVQYSINNGSWTTYTKEVTLAYGTHTVRAKVIDNTGNESTIASKTITRIVPVPTVSGNYKLNGWVKENVTINASSVNTVYYSLNSGAWTQMPGNTLTISTEKNHTLQVKAVSGSVESQVVTLKFGIDKTAPLAPTINKTESGFVITNNGDNLSGIKEIRYSTDGLNWIVYEGKVSLESGHYTIQAKSIDNVGNESAIKSLEIAVNYLEMTLNNNSINFIGSVNGSSEQSISVSTISSHNYRINLKASNDFKGEKSSNTISIGYLKAKIDQGNYKDMKLIPQTFLETTTHSLKNSHNIYFSMNSLVGYPIDKYNSEIQVIAESY